jgi:hypothetical protein
MDSKFWQKALREAERELDAGTTRTALDAAERYANLTRVAGAEGHRK